MIQEIIMFPYLYVKVAITVGFLSVWYKLVPMILFWIIFGPLILLYSLAKDMFYYIKLLCDY